MHKLSIRTIGQAQEAWQRAAIEQYQERLRPFARVSLTEYEEQAESATRSLEQLQEREAEKLLKNLPDGCLVIALDERGKAFASPLFAETLATWGETGREIVFLIGGSNGLHASVRERADYLLSFGPQTLPHILARIVLLEQLYRAEKILRGSAYHK